MAQLTSGIHRLLNHPGIYRASQRLFGAARNYRELVSEFLGPPPVNRILDIGCGTADILAYLPEDVEYWGFDISGEYLSSAALRFPGRGRFIRGNADDASLTREKAPRFDVVLGIGLLHHLEDSEVRSLAQLASKWLRVGGRLVTIDPCFVPNQNPIAKALIRSDRGRNVRTALGYRSLVADHFSQIKGEVRHRRFPPYTHWIMACND